MDVPRETQHQARIAGDLSPTARPGLQGFEPDERVNRDRVPGWEYASARFCLEPRRTAGDAAARAACSGCSRAPAAATDGYGSRRGCLFLNNRYHDPALGTFISVDPLVGATGEAYIYASGNPTTLSDPLGLCSVSHHDGETCADAVERARGGGTGASPSKPPTASRTQLEQADNISWWANCDEQGGVTFTGACTAADKLRSGTPLDELGPYLVGFDPAALLFLEDQYDALFALLNAGAAAAFEATGALPDYFVLDVEAILSTGFLAGVGGGGLVVITRSGTVFAGPQLNLGTGGVSIAGRAGYLIQPGPFWAASDGQDVDSAIAGWSFSGSVTNWPGYSRSVVIGLNGDTVPTGLSGAV